MSMAVDGTANVPSSHIDGALLGVQDGVQCFRRGPCPHRSGQEHADCEHGPRISILCLFNGWQTDGGNWMSRWMMIGAALLASACGKKEGAAPTAPASKPDKVVGATPAASKDPAPKEPVPQASEDGEVVYHPNCAKLLPKGLIAKTHGALETRPARERDGNARCELFKGGDGVIGIVEVTCAPNLDAELPATLKIEREAQTEAKELSPMVGRAGYRLGDRSFVYLDDDAPCRLHVTWADAAPANWADALRAIAAGVTPASIK